jgi:hypothetical protein
MPKLASIDSISDDRNASETLELIAEFQRCDRAVVAGIQKQAGSKDLLGAWRQGRLKRSGRLLAPTGKERFMESAVVLKSTVVSSIWISDPRSGMMGSTQLS